MILDKKLDNKCKVLFDAFSGTASVGSALKDMFTIVSNDNLYFSFVISQAKLNPPDGKFENLEINPFVYFNTEKCTLKGYIYKNYSLGNSNRMYFSEENAMKIDFIRWQIEEWKENNKINESEYYYLIASLIESVSKVANVAGVYGAYLKKWDPRAIKTMKYIPIEVNESKSICHNIVYNDKIENLINKVNVDILYLDPPYTKNQYSVQYHLLETIARYDAPQIKGITGARNTSAQASDFSKPGKVNIEFERLVACANCKYIIMSYSSDGIMTKEYIEYVLKRYGKEDTFEFRKIPYKKYLNSKTKKGNEHFEYLFYIEKKEKAEVYYYSPLNYMGGKAEMVNFIKQNSPKNISRLVDVFAGGFNVGINYDVEEVIYNDFNHKVKELIEMFRR